MLLDLWVLIASEKVGGDSADTGWNKSAWKKKQQREEAIAQTIEATYLKLVGVEPAQQVVAEIKAEVRKDERVAKLDYTQELRLVEWLSAQINAIRRKQYLDELDDEEAILLLL